MSTEIKETKKTAELSEKMKLIMADLQAHPDQSWFASQIADRTGLENKSVNPVLTALCKRELVGKEDGEEEVIDSKTGAPKKVAHKMYFLTDAGKALEINA